MKNRKKVFLVFAGICALCVFVVLGRQITSKAETKAKRKVIDNFKYTYIETSPDRIRILCVEPISEQGISTLKIPTLIDGKKVVRLAAWDNDTNIFGVYHLEEDWRLMNVKIYNRVKKIQKIVLPDTVKKISGSCFSLITSGKSIYIPAGLENNVRALCKTSWKKVTISPGNKKYKVKDGLLLSKNGKTVYGSVSSKKAVRIPVGVKTISDHSIFSGGKTTDIYIPSSVDKIGFQSLFFKDVVRFHVAKGNPHYAEADDCIYSKKTGRLVAACVKDSVFTVPSKVTVLRRTNFSGTEVKKFVIPPSVKKIDDFWCPYRENMTYEFQGKKPPVINKFFVSSGVTFYVPKGSREAYEKAVKWTNDRYAYPVTIYEW